MAHDTLYRLDFNLILFLRIRNRKPTCAEFIRKDSSSGHLKQISNVLKQLWQFMVSPNTKTYDEKIRRFFNKARFVLSFRRM